MVKLVVLFDNECDGLAVRRALDLVPSQNPSIGLIVIMNGLTPPASTIEVTDCTFCEVGPVQERGWLTLGLETGACLKRGSLALDGEGLPI
jgi:hypothetical protein